MSGATDSPSVLLELKGLSRSFQEGDRAHVVLDGVDARFTRGELVAVVGPSGSGKSTLLNLVSGIDLPDRGRILVDGEDLTSMSERDRTLFRRRSVGFVFQFFNLLPTLTVLENLLLPVELKGRISDRERERALGLLESVGLRDRADAFPDRLSGGEQQRVTVCRALVHEPLLILADEPTGNLDRDTGDRVLSVLERLVREAGRTLIMVTHSLEAADMADRVLSLRGGKLVPEGEGPHGRPPGSEPSGGPVPDRQRPG